MNLWENIDEKNKNNTKEESKNNNDLLIKNY